MRQVRGWEESKVGFFLVINFSQTWSKTLRKLFCERRERKGGNGGEMVGCEEGEG